MSGLALSNRLPQLLIVSIERLLTWCSPTTIPRLVALVIVDPGILTILRGIQNTNATKQPPAGP